METKVWHLEDNRTENEQAIEAAASLLNRGSIVAFPTETVYGLGADATNEAAVRKIFKAKGRPQDNPLIAHVATKQQLLELINDLPTYAEKLIDAFSPGPITFVLSSNGKCASNVMAGLSTIAVRIPDHPIALQLLKVCGTPIAAPSANISGKPSPTTAAHVLEDLTGKIAGILDGGPTGVGMESTVIDCTGKVPTVLRPGGITKEQLENVVETIRMDPSLADSQEHPISPGLKYKHYAPEVPLWVVSGNRGEIQEVIDKEQANSSRIGVLASTKTSTYLQADQIIPLGENINEIAANLYDALRVFKKSNVDLIICESFPEKGIGEAIMNRLRKAASATL